MSKCEEHDSELVCLKHIEQLAALGISLREKAQHLPRYTIYMENGISVDDVFERTCSGIIIARLELIGHGVRTTLASNPINFVSCYEKISELSDCISGNDVETISNKKLLAIIQAFNLVPPTYSIPVGVIRKSLVIALC